MLSGLLRRAALCIALGLVGLGTPSPSLARAPQGPPGTLIDYDSKAGAPAGAQAWRIRYVSQNESGKPIEVTGVVIAIASPFCWVTGAVIAIFACGSFPPKM